jgi:hypothetical protein
MVTYASEELDTLVNWVAALSNLGVEFRTEETAEKETTLDDILESFNTKMNAILEKLEDISAQNEASAASSGSSTSTQTAATTTTTETDNSTSTGEDVSEEVIEALTTDTDTDTEDTESESDSASESVGEEDSTNV